MPKAGAKMFPINKLKEKVKMQILYMMRESLCGGTNFLWLSNSKWTSTCSSHRNAVLSLGKITAGGFPMSLWEVSACNTLLCISQHLAVFRVYSSFICVDFTS